MYTVEIRDHVMIAHSLRGDVFGPAQQLHGATYIVDVAFMRSELGVDAIIVDIGLASQCVKQVLAKINYRNLDEHPEFKDRRSTTEALARWVFAKIAEAIKRGQLGDVGLSIERVRVTMHESHVARASFEADVA